jgi:hypothetical protein
MALSFPTLLFVIDLGPRTRKAATVCPLVHRCTQVFIAGPTELDPVSLTGLKTDWRCASIALECFMVFESAAVITALTEKPWSQFLRDSGKGTEKIMVRVFAEQLLNTIPIATQLLME